VRPLPQCGPLAEEEELAKLDEIDLLGVCLHPVEECLGLAAGERPRPLVPGCSVVGILEGSKEGVVGEPVAVVITELRKRPRNGGGLGIAESAVGPPEEIELEGFHPIEIHPLGLKFRNIDHLGLVEDVVLDQEIGADQELIAGKGRDRRVR